MTTPTIPTESIIAKDWTFIKAHLALIVLAAALAAGSVYGVDSLIAKHDLAAEKAADARLAVAISQTTAAQNILATTQQQLLVMVQQLQAQNAKLSQNIVVRNTQTATQVKNDATLNAQQAAERLSTQTQATAGEIVATDNSLNIDISVARRVIANLDLLGAAQADLADTTQQLNNETQLFNKSQDENKQQATVIGDLQLQNQEQVTACAVEIKSLKAANRKSKIKTFFIGFGIGFVTGFTAHLW